MNHDPHIRGIRSLDLERLVDGQLDGEQYRRLLARISKHPDGWRRCAMAFLENQALESELRAIGHDPDDPDGLASLFGAGDLGELSAGQEPAHAAPKSTSTATTRGIRKSSLNNWSVIAASLLLAVTTGLVIRSLPDPVEADAMPILATTINQPVSNAVSSPTTGNTHDDLMKLSGIEETLTISLPELGSQSHQLPVDSENEASNSATGGVVPSELTKLLNEPTHKDRVVFPVRDKQGKQHNLRIDSYEFHPSEAYQ